MSMTKKDFILIADRISKLRARSTADSPDTEQWIQLLCRTFSEINPRFNEDTFRKACEPRS